MRLIDNMRVAGKVATATGLALILLVIVGAIAVIGLATLQSNFGEYRSTAQRSLAAGELQSTILAANIAVKDFILTSSEAREADVHQHLATARDTAIAARDADPAIADAVRGILEQIDAFDAAFREIVPLQRERNRLAAQMAEASEAADTTAEEVLTRQRRLTNAIAVYNASLVMRNLLLADSKANAFLLDPGAATAEAAKADFAELQKALAALDRTVRDPSAQELVDLMGVQSRAFEQVFDSVAATVLAQTEIVENRIDRIGPALAEQMEQARRNNSTVQAGIGDRTTAAMQDTLWLVVAVGIAALLVGILAAFLVGRGIARPIQAMTSAMTGLAQGDRNTEIPSQGRRDEIGEMAEAVQVFRDNMARNEELAARQEQERAERERRADAITALTRDFDEAVAGMLAQVGAATSQMQSTATSMSATAEETSRQASAVAAASEQASANVQTVASAAEELSGSIREISGQVAQSATIAAKASSDAQRTNVQVDGLAQAAQKIGEVVNLIQDIAEQTNLLALNATIEAARAGEAGKGFAVVASEVKNLANQTAKATEQIGKQIGGIQSETAEAVTAIQGIGSTIAEINEIATSIASAVEEQGAATQEISRNVQEAARGTQEVSANIGGVTRAAGETGNAADQVNVSAGNVAEQSERLSRTVQEFLAAVRAA